MTTGDQGVPTLPERLGIEGTGQGSDLADAHATFDRHTNAPVIALGFNKTGAHAFARLNVVRDDAVLSEPLIREPVLAGTGW